MAEYKDVGRIIGGVSETALQLAARIKSYDDASGIKGMLAYCPLEECLVMKTGPSSFVRVYDENAIADFLAGKQDSFAVTAGVIPVGAVGGLADSGLSVSGGVVVSGSAAVGIENSTGDSFEIVDGVATSTVPVVHPSAVSDNQSATLEDAKSVASNILEPTSENLALADLVSQLSGVIRSGFDLTQDATNIYITSGVVVTRLDATEESQFRRYEPIAVSKAKSTIANSSTWFVYTDGASIVITQSLAFVTNHQAVPLYVITRGYNGTFFIDDIRFLNRDKFHNQNYQRLVTRAITKAESSGSLSVNATTKAFTISQMEIFFLDLPSTLTAFDSTVTSFVHSYRNGAGGFTVSTRPTLDWTKWDDGDGALVSVSTQKYGNHWVFIDTSGSGVVHVVLGQAEHATIADAQKATIPAVRLGELGDYTTFEQAFRVVISGGGVVGAIDDLMSVAGGGANPVTNPVTPSWAQTLAVSRDAGGKVLKNIGNADADTDAVNRIAGDARWPLLNSRSVWCNTHTGWGLRWKKLLTRHYTRSCGFYAKIESASDFGNGKPSSMRLEFERHDSINSCGWSISEVGSRVEAVDFVVTDNGANTVSLWVRIADYSSSRITIDNIREIDPVAGVNGSTIENGEAPPTDTIVFDTANPSTLLIGVGNATADTHAMNRQTTWQGGTTASRPRSPVLYMRYFDTTLQKLITWNGTSWVTTSNHIEWLPYTSGASFLFPDFEIDIRLSGGSTVQIQGTTLGNRYTSHRDDGSDPVNGTAKQFTPLLSLIARPDGVLFTAKKIGNKITYDAIGYSGDDKIYRSGTATGDTIESFLFSGSIITSRIKYL